MQEPLKTDPQPELLYGVPQISAYLGLGERKTRRLLEEDPTLPGFRLGETGLWMAKPADLAEWLEKPHPKSRRKYIYLEE